MSHLKIIDFQSSYSDSPEQGVEVIDDVLYNCFGIKKQSIFSKGFVTDDDPE